MDPKKYDQYQASLKAYRDNLAVITYKFQEGWKEGREKGLEEGREKGLEEGREKGREEGIAMGIAQNEAKLLDTVRNFKASGVSTEIIMQATGLSREAIEQL
jgi:predicted transposase/invertase (TIGR01784 family)